MKKQISLFLVLVLCVCMVTKAIADTGLSFVAVPVLADVKKMDGDFTIRGGVMFGMTPEEVREFEPSNWHENKYGFDKKYENYGVSDLDILAGITIELAKSDMIVYGFDKESRKLKEIYYWFGYFKDDHFSELRSNIEKKYGEPLHANDGQVFSATTALTVSTSGASTKILSNCCEWVVQYENYYVIIQAWSFEWDDGGYEIGMGYKVLSADEVDRMTGDYEDGVQDNQQKKEDSVERDL